MNVVQLYPSGALEDSRGAFAQWLRVAWQALPKGALWHLLNRSHLALELYADSHGIRFVLWFTNEEVQSLLLNQLVALMPGSEVVIAEVDSPTVPGQGTELVLARAEKATLYDWKTSQPDPAVELFAACSQVREGEAQVVQLLLRPSPRGSAAMGAPTFHALVRMAGYSASAPRRRALVRALSSSLGSHHGAGWFLPHRWLPSQSWLLGDMRSRSWPLLSLGQFLLTADEAASIYHVPPATVARELPLQRASVRRVHLPETLPATGLSLGTGLRHARETEAYLDPKSLLYHLLVVGPTGTGKTTFLARLAPEIARAGSGFTLLDPHGDLAQRALAALPKEAASRTLYLPFADRDLVPALTLFSADEGEEYRTADEFVALIRRISGERSWGPVLELTLRYLAQAVLEAKGTIIDIASALDDETERLHLLRQVRDPEAIRFVSRLSRLPDRQAQQQSYSSLNRLHRFLSAPPVRQLLGHRQQRLTPETMLHDKLNVICDLSGLGPRNARLIGSLLVTRLKEAAMARRTDDPPHILILDECSWFLSSGLAEVADQTRKFGLGLVMATQRLSQLEPPSLHDSILSNAGNLLMFQASRLEDARGAVQALSSTAITVEDIRHLSLGESYLRVVSRGRRVEPFWLKVPAPQPIGEQERERARGIMARSRKEFMISRKLVDEELRRGRRAEDEPDREVRAIKRAS